MSGKNTPLRARDIIVVKMVDWTDDSSDAEPAYDIEVYINGKFVPNKSKVFPVQKGKHKGDKKSDAFSKAKNFAINALSDNIR